MAPWTFQSVIGATDTLPTKRDPTSELLSARNMGLSPDNMLYAGDSGVDMQTALAAGMTPVGVTWGFRSREELLSSGATRLINHPSELLFLLDQ
jgi:phosphoglycolate phosphatase